MSLFGTTRKEYDMATLGSIVFGLGVLAAIFGGSTETLVGGLAAAALGLAIFWRGSATRAYLKAQQNAEAATRFTDEGEQR